MRFITVEKEQLISRLIQHGYLKSDAVIAAMRHIPRELFVPPHQRKFAYADTPLEIGHGQTISAPHMVAIMLEALELKSNSKVLEIGTGTGYHAALAATIARNGTVYTVERIPHLAEEARKNLKTLHIKNVKVFTGDGSLGLPEHAPFTHIYATCAAPSVPDALIAQLDEGGRLLMPVGRAYGELVMIQKNGEIRKTNLGGCSFVPMVGREAYDEH